MQLADFVTHHLLINSTKLIITDQSTLSDLNTEILKYVPFFDKFRNRNQSGQLFNRGMVGICNFYVKDTDPSILQYCPIERSNFVKPYQKGDLYIYKYIYIYISKR
jgi:hypothetical protein